MNRSSILLAGRCVALAAPLALAVPLATGAASDPALPAATEGQSGEATIADARARIESGDLAAAIELLGDALARQPDSRKLRQALGSAHLRNVDVEAAERVLAPLLESGRDADVVLAAEVFLGAGRISRGLEILEEALEERPRSVELWTYLGRARVASGQPTSGEQALRRALELGDAAAPHHYLGWLLFAAGRTEEGIGHLQRAVDLAPSEPDYLHRAGQAYLETGDAAAAAGMFEILSVVEPEAARGPLWLGRAQIDGHRLQEAVGSFETALRRDPGNPLALYHLGYVAWRMGDAETAEERYREALRQGPEDAATWHGLGILLYQTDRPAEAAEVLARAVELQPGFADAWFFRAKALLALERDEEGLEALERAVQLQPALSKAWYQLAIEYGRLGRSEDAAAAMKRFRDTREQRP